MSQDAERLFLEAVDLPREQRRAFLLEHCTTEELRREVDSLLAGDDMAESFLKSAVVEAAESLQQMTDQPASPDIGPWRITRELGRGGMGVVYAAERSDGLFSQQVAIKVIQRRADQASLIARFERERRILAGLSHPNVARLFDGGTSSDGLPYLVMEHVDGVPISTYVRDRSLGVRQTVELFLGVCSGVEHAHRHFIVHRDIKPGNILVAADGVVKLLDFGIARMMSDDAHSETQTLAVTLEYASPEQVRGEPVTTATDVYSLGGVLYQLLTGQTPLQLGQTPLDDCLRSIIERMPRDPLELRPAIGRDLSYIVLRALRKEPDRRYPSVEALRLDLERYLKGFPVEARGNSPAYRARKFAYRYRVALATICAFILVLVVAAGISIRQSLRANREAAAARAVSDFLQNDLLAQASANNQSGPAARPNPHLEVRTALDRAAARIAGQFDRQPEVEAAIRVTIGQTYGELGQYPEARKQLERALDLYRRTLGAENPKTLEAMSRLGSTALHQGKFPEAEALLYQAVQLQRRALGPEHAQTLRSSNNLANTYLQQGKYPQAEALHTQTLQIRRHLFGPEHPDTLESLIGLANTYYLQGKYAQAEVLYSQTSEVQRRVLGPEHPDTLAAMNNLSNTYSLQGKYAQADAVQSQTLEIRRRAQGPEHPDTLMSMVNLASIEYAEGKYGQAEALQRQTLGIERHVLGPEHPLTLASMLSLADVYAEQGRYVEAEALFRQALEIQRRLIGPAHPDTLDGLSDFAAMYQRQGKYALAETHAAEVLAGRRHALGPEHPNTLTAAADLALAYQSQGEWAKSEPLAREAVEIDRKNRPDDWQRFRAESLFGASLAGEKKYAEAEQLLLEGYQGMAARKERIAVPDWYHLDRAIEWIVQLYQAWGKTEKAAEWSQKLQPTASPRPRVAIR